MKILTLGDYQLLAPQTIDDVAPYSAQIVALYKQVFGDEIWCEGKKCMICNKNYSFSQATICRGTCCESDLIDFYTDQDVLDMLQDLFSQRFQMRLVLTGKEIVASQWGWITTVDKLNRDKLALIPSALIKLKESLTDKGLGDDLVYYRSENGVKPEFRRKGLARSMYESIRTTLRGELRVCLSRTSPQSPQFQLSQMWGDQIVFRYQDNTDTCTPLDDNRVLFAGRL